MIPGANEKEPMSGDAIYLISDSGELRCVNAVSHAKLLRRSHDVVIRIYHHQAGKMIKTHVTCVPPPSLGAFR